MGLSRCKTPELLFTFLLLRVISHSTVGHFITDSWVTWSLLLGTLNRSAAEVLDSRVRYRSMLLKKKIGHLGQLGGVS